MVEILAPAGNKECFLAAVNAGANAVYLGLKDFSARSGIDNFNYEELEWVINYASIFGIKIYLTVNTLIKNNELNDYFNAIEKAYDLGVDAFIVQDIFLGKILKEKFPNIILHLSTQAGISSPTVIEEVKNYGFSRVVLARETNFDDIKAIANKIETEVFIQGALCSSYSGHCYFSSFIGGNSGNRGLCKQPCRKKYTLKINKTVKKEGFLLSLSDLSLGEKIKELKEIGVYSFKIEGRRRRPEYVYSALKYCKDILSGNSSTLSFSDLKRSFNRGNYTKGLAFGQKNDFISDKIQGHIGETVGIIESKKGKFATVKLTTNYLPKEKDAYKLISKNGFEIGNAVFNKVTNDSLIISINGNASVGDIVNLTTDVSLSEKVLSASRKQIIEIIAKFIANDKAEITCNYNDREVTVSSENVLDVGNTLFLTEEEVIACFNKVDGLPFIPKLTVIIEGKPFIPKSKLNNLRRDFYSKLFNFERKQKVKKTLTIQDEIISDRINYNTVIISNDFTSVNLQNSAYVLFPDDYNNDLIFNTYFKQATKSNAKTYLFIPAYFNTTDEEIILKRSKNFYGVYVDSYQGVIFAKKYGLKYFSGTGVNITNNIDVCAVDTPFVISKELSLKDCNAIIAKNNNAFVFYFGKTTLMDLIYCPLGKTCSKCYATDNMQLIDENNRAFALRRYKISSCRFNLYNAYDLICPNSLVKNKVINLIGYSEQMRKLIVENLSNTEKLKEIIINYTAGNLNKGIL